METIFNHNPTAKEIAECGFFDTWQRIRHGIDFTEPITRESYERQITKEAALMDIGLLLEYRGQDAETYWKRIPEKAQEYKLGQDYEQNPIS